MLASLSADRPAVADLTFFQCGGRGCAGKMKEKRKGLGAGSTRSARREGGSGVTVCLRSGAAVSIQRMMENDRSWSMKGLCLRRSYSAISLKRQPF